MPCFWYRAARRNKLHLHLPWHCSVCSWVWVSSIPTIPPAEQFLALLWDQMLQDAKAGCPIWAILFSISAAFRHPLQLSCRAWLDQPSKELLLLLKKEYLREYRSMFKPHTDVACGFPQHSGEGPKLEQIAHISRQQQLLLSWSLVSGATELTWVQLCFSACFKHNPVDILFPSLAPHKWSVFLSAGGEKILLCEATWDPCVCSGHGGQTPFPLLHITFKEVFQIDSFSKVNKTDILCC